MYYLGELTIPAGTSESSPETLAVSLCKGYIKGFRVLFPAGHSGLTRVQVWHHQRQIIPTTPGVALRGDDHPVEFPDRYEISDPPYEVELRGWSPDATLDHTVYVAFEVEAWLVRQAEVAVFVGLPEGF